MRRSALAAPLALVLLASSARAAPPGDAAAFDAADAEGRWAVYRESREPVAAWAAFLAARKEWDLLEWMALTTRTSEALRALEEADAPGWARCAVWRLRGTDSHSVEVARELLLGRRSGQVLSWLESWKEALTGPAVGVLAALRAKDPPVVRENASRLEGPWPADVVLRDLEPPALVETALPGPRARLGAVYVQQVERALDAWARSALKTEPWVAKVAALLKHAHPRVRRAAALASAEAPPDLIPTDALTALLDDAGQPTGVRAAAAIGVSFAPSPGIALRLLRIATDVTHPAWTAAVSRLGDLGAEFAAERLAAIDAGDLKEASRTLRDDSVRRIRARLAGEDSDAFAARVPSMLRTAAWADLRCDPLEGDLVPFTLARVGARAKEPPVRALLDALKSAPKTKDDVEERVREYATTILAGGEGRAK